MKFKILLVLVFLLWSCIAQAAWSGPKKISVLKAQEDGSVLVILEDFVNNDPNIQCGTSHFFFSDSGENNFNTRVSFLLSSYIYDHVFHFFDFYCHSFSLFCCIAKYQPVGRSR